MKSSRSDRASGAASGSTKDTVLRIEQILSKIDSPAYVLDSEGRIIYLNPISEILFKTKSKKSGGTPLAVFLHSESREKGAMSFKETLKSGSGSYELIPDAEGASYECAETRIDTAEGKFIVGIASKQTGSKDNENSELERLRSEFELIRNDFETQSLSLWKSEEKYYRLLDISNDAIILAALDSGILLFANKRAEALIGKPLEQIAGRKLIELESKDDGDNKNFYDHLIKTVESDPEAYRTKIFEGTLTGKSGNRNDVLITCDTAEIDGKRILQCVLKDITLIKAAEAGTRMFKCAAGTCAKSVATLTTDGAIEYVNNSFVNAWGFSSTELVGRHIINAGLNGLSNEEFTRIKGTLKSNTVWKGTVKGKKKDGTDQTCNAQFTPLADKSGNITNIILTHEDPGESKVRDEKMRYLANMDKVTGLLNRSRFIELMSEELKSGRQGVLLLMDLDHFKLINDSHGQGKGDDFLSSVAMVLKTTLKFLEAKQQTADNAQNILGRLSGDEFAVYLPSLSKTRGFAAAEEFRKTLEGFYSPDLNGRVTASIGIAASPEHGKTPPELLTSADAAMYRAKDEGRNRSHIFELADRQIDGMQSRLTMKNDIIVALKGNNFDPWFQPILNIKKNSIDHYEALARMKSPNKGIVLPSHVIDVAERFGLVGSIDKMIIEKSLRLHKEITKSQPDIKFCMNLSGKNVGDPDFLANLKGIIAKTSSKPENIVFEITETAAVNDLSRAVSFVNDLKSIGCNISIDDFGIGFTSFLYLREMKADYIKIAGSFIKDLDQNLNDRLFVKSISEVAKGMNIKIIAEFVEKEETLNILRDFGVDYAQGYLVGKPTDKIC